VRWEIIITTYSSKISKTHVFSLNPPLCIQVSKYHYSYPSTHGNRGGQQEVLVSNLGFIRRWQMSKYGDALSMPGSSEMRDALGHCYGVNSKMHVEAEIE